MNRSPSAGWAQAALSGGQYEFPKGLFFGGIAPTWTLKHTIEDAPDKGPVLDAAIIGQYQRMTHYGITGFGTVAAFAKALKLQDDTKQLKAAVKELYGADELMTELAEAAVNKEAADE